jgi:hypothetical protein
MMASVDTGIGRYFGEMHGKATEVNYDGYFANNTYAGLYAFLAFEKPLNAFINKQQEDPFLQRMPGTVDQAVGQLQGIAALLRHRQETGCRDINCGPGTPYTEIQASIEEDVIRFEWTSEDPKVEEWYVEHRGPQMIYFERKMSIKAQRTVPSFHVIYLPIAECGRHAIRLARNVSATDPPSKRFGPTRLVLDKCKGRVPTRPSKDR